MRNVNALHPRLRLLAPIFVERCGENGLTVGIGECVRSVSEQDELYEKGRSKKGSIVTNARGSSYMSMHQWGIAFDFYRNDGKGAYNNADGFFDKAGKIGESLGLEWGGRWKKISDKPHFQLPDWGSTPKKLKMLYTVPENFMEIWEDCVMTEGEKRELEKIKNDIEELKRQSERVYRYTEELPEWARDTIQHLMDMGIYSGSSESDLNLPETLMRALVINARAGVYENKGI